MKTKEEAAKQTARDILELSGLKPLRLNINLDTIIGYLEIAFMEGAKFAEQWISVEDGLPDYFKEVLINVEFQKLGSSSKSIAYDIGILDNKGWESAKIGMHHKNNVPAKNTYKVTHWQPINR